MSPKIKVVLGFVACVATAAAIVWTLPSIAVHFGMRLPTGHGSQGDDVLLLVMIAPILTFIVGAVMMRRTFHAATKTDGGAFILTGAFATFPIWFVPIGVAVALAVIDRMHASKPDAPDISLYLQDARYTDNGSEVTITMRLHPIVTKPGIGAFDLEVWDPYGGWSIDREGPHRGRITAVRGANSFKYEEMDSHEPLLDGVGGSVIVPIVIKRWTPDVHEVPSSIFILIYPNSRGPQHRSGANIKQTLNFPWAHPSDNR